MINEHEVDRQGSWREDCINAMTTQSNVSKETQEIGDDYDVEEEEDIQKRSQFCLISRNAWQNKEIFFCEWRESNDVINFNKDVWRFLN